MPGNQPKVRPIARKALSKRQALSPAAALLALIQSSLDDDKAENVAVIDMAGKSAIADFMVVATGRSSRHVASMAEHLRERMKPEIGRAPPVEGLTQADWVLVDVGDVVVHLFRAEVRALYNLEKMWSQALPEQQDGMAGLVKQKIVAKSKPSKKKPTKAKPAAKPATKNVTKKKPTTRGSTKKPVAKGSTAKKPAIKGSTKKPAAKGSTKKPAAKTKPAAKAAPRQKKPAPRRQPAARRRVAR